LGCIGVPAVPSSVTSRLYRFQVAVGSLLTAMSRWLSPVKSPDVGSISRASTVRKNDRVVGSYRQDGSVTNGPRSPVVRSICAG